ncbi:hypothetical protein JCGZ_10977 [Jatropha curcas]|uniref:Uncharacterized protein n=1 Tax=Jatropha curcas TaxID=180498 RepID=A0A067LH46_JATCU|nr:hypothetical protein JCGZ_10977 [Jatropha curcas]
MAELEIFARNRRSETTDDEAGPSRHTGGSISAIETSRLLAENNGREPTSMEVFTYTHTKDYEGNTFVDKRALSVNENYRTAREHVVSSRAGSKAESRINELALYLEAVGGEKKRKGYGIDPEGISALRARVDEQERQLAELRAHVMRMSGYHALHQALSSPLDPDTADDTLVTPTDTTTHLVDTTINLVDTTLDRPEDRHHRFDFGPF